MKARAKNNTLLNYTDSEILVHDWDNDDWDNVAADTLLTAADYDNTEGSDTYKNFVGYIEITNAPMYIDQDLDVQQVSENGVDTDSVLLKIAGDGPDSDNDGIGDGDPKNLKFGKNNKVSAKLNLITSIQQDATDSGMTTTGYTPVVTNKELVSKVIKTSTNESKIGKADAFLKAITVTDDTYGYGEVPVAVVKGYNDLTGSLAIRLWTDAHGDDQVRYGHYKDDTNFALNTAE